MTLRRSQLPQLTGPESFVWATGIEDTFITAPWPRTGRTLDEYELTDHYNQWQGDLALMRELGIKAARYGVPWHRIQPQRNKWDWSFADQTLERLLELEIEPIVDLVHYGLPLWIDGAYLNPDYPCLMAEYAARLAERFKGRIRAYTPLNEPRITAWYCGRLGWWPPFRRGWSGFTEVMLGVCRGIVQTIEALQSVDPDILFVHVDATDLYESPDPQLSDEVAHRQEIVFLALDLVSGRINEEHALWNWLQKVAPRGTDFEWFTEHAKELPLVGINLYPMFSRKILTRPGRSLRIRMPYADATIVERLAELYWQRYQRPLMISETASVGSVARRDEWLESSMDAVRRTRSRGIPLVGYTWWPMFALVTWAYRQGEHPPEYYIKQMGLWDLDERPGGGLRRISTPLVEKYRRFAEAGAERVGTLQNNRKENTCFEASSLPDSNVQRATMRSAIGSTK